MRWLSESRSRRPIVLDGFISGVRMRNLIFFPPKAKHSLVQAVPENLRRTTDMEQTQTSV